MTSEWPFAGMLEQVADERVLVPELDATDVATELFLAPVNLKKERFFKLLQGRQGNYCIELYFL